MRIQQTLCTGLFNKMNENKKKKKNNTNGSCSQCKYVYMQCAYCISDPCETKTEKSKVKYEKKIKHFILCNHKTFYCISV